MYLGMGILGITRASQPHAWPVGAKIQLENGAVGFDNKVNYTGISIVFSF